MSYRTLAAGVVVLALIAGVIVAACGGKAASTVPASTSTVPVSKAAVEPSTANEAMKKDEPAAMEKKDEAAMEKKDEAAMEKKDEGMVQKDEVAMEKEDEAMMEKDESTAMEEKSAIAMELPKKIVAPHFVDSTPVHGEKLGEAPDEIVLKFNFNLHPDSAITVTRDGNPVSLDETSISDDELSMTVLLSGDGADGVYQVNYKACWPDRSCHEGSVAFIVDSSIAMMEKDDAMQKDDEAIAMEKKDEAMVKEDEAMAEEDEMTMEKKDEGMMAEEKEAMATEEDEAMVKEDDAMMADEKEAMMAAELPDKIVAPHFVDSYPAHGDSLPQAPQEVVLNFNFNLHPDSAITLTRDSQPVSLGNIAFSPDELSMRAAITGEAGDGVYQVNYKACWPDRSCHEGSVAFVVDGKLTSKFADMRGKAEVVVHMADNQFGPKLLIVSPGTKLTWVNDDDTIHFVNTDPHPSHNVVAALNSSSLRLGDSYSYTFDEEGAWGYHCSAHFNLGMTAQVLVQ